MILSLSPDELKSCMSSKFELTAIQMKTTCWKLDFFVKERCCEDDMPSHEASYLGWCWVPSIVI